MLLRRLGAIALVIAATTMAVYGVAGSSRLSGPVLVTLWSTHGIHRDDLIIVACWAICMAAAAVFWFSTDSRDD